MADLIAQAAAENQGVVPPGTEGGSATAGQSAETLNTDNGPPENIPYSRFKEVNDQLRQYKPLEELGYDPEALMRLAQWEMDFGTDPAAQWMELGERLDLPEPVMEAIKAATGGSTDSNTGTGEVTPPAAPVSDEPPPWAKPLLQDREQRMAQEEQQGRQQVLDSILTKWNELDDKAGIKIPESQKLTYIMAASGGNATTVDEIVEVARKEALEMVELGRSTVLVPGGNTPRTVPGSATPVSAPPVTPRTLQEASAQAKADLESGRLSR